MGIFGGSKFFCLIICTIFLFSCENRSERALSYKNMAYEYLDADNYSEAFKYYNKAYELDPEIADYYFYNNRGLAARKIGDSLVALADWEKAILLDSVAAEARDNLSSVYYNQGLDAEMGGRFYDALEKYNRAIAIDSTITMFYVNRGLLKLNLKDTIGSRNDYLKAIELDSLCTLAYFNMGCLVMATGEYDVAVYYLTKYVKLEPGNDEGYAILAGALYNKKMYKEAILMMEVFMRFQPYDPDSYYFLGMCYKNLGNYLEARRYLEKARDLGNKDVIKELEKMK